MAPSPMVPPTLGRCCARKGRATNHGRVTDLRPVWQGPPMQNLPVDANDLTPAFLSEALGTEVTQVDLLDHAFATNQRARIGLTYATLDAGPATLFVKLAPIDPAHR